MRNNESHLLRPFFNIIEESNTDMARAALKIIMKKKELDPELLDHPKGLLPEQTGKLHLLTTHLALLSFTTHLVDTFHNILVICLFHHILSIQPTGEYDDPVKNEFFEKGLRYCMDSTRDPSDWRRGSLECAFECITPTKPPRHLKST